MVLYQVDSLSYILSKFSFRNVKASRILHLTKCILMQVYYGVSSLSIRLIIEQICLLTF